MEEELQINFTMR